MSNPQSAQLVTHLLTQTTSTLALLESLRVISAEDAQVIKSRLPNAYGPFPSLESAATTVAPLGQSPVPSLPPRSDKPLDVGMGQLTVREPPLPPTVQLQSPGLVPHARALWDYRGNEPDDLAFSSGEILVVDEHVNPQWCRGHLLDNPSRRGLFPSNYIEMIPPPMQAQNQGPIVPYAPYDKQAAPYQGHQGPMQMQPPPMHYQPPQQVYQPPPQPEHEKKGKFGKIGGQLGNAAVNGAGFGFGASIASEMVHKIF